ncbi:MAG: hypothetical protein OXI51_04720 [Chloroflexota bacterium]|nr:hypothetical protein [Chloroflexota bacterium]
MRNGDSTMCDKGPTASRDLAAAESEPQRRKRLLAEVVADFEARGVGLRMEENLTREKLYNRFAD